MSGRQPSFAEFVTLVALLTAMVALSIDAMLPALGEIASDLGARGTNDRQYILIVFFAGLAVGQIFYGPLSDSTGRKPAAFAGLLLYAIGALVCLLSTSFPVMLAGRALQGFGAAGPRIVAIAMVRDGQAGNAMARVMSVVMSVFMLVPILAPSIGQAIVTVSHWRVIFAGFLVIALIAVSWLALRQPETLPVERRLPFSLAAIWAATREVLGNRITLGYTLASGCIFGSFVSYLGTSQQIFQEQYGQGKLFAVWFGVLALAVAIAMIVNARLVMRHGMRRLSALALRTLCILSVIFFAVVLITNGHPPLWAFATYMFLNFFCSGILFGNFSSIAMEPMGRIVGMASAITTSLSTLIALTLGGLLGQLYNGTLVPLISGFAVLSLAALAATAWGDRGHAQS
jgi:DHA1 family bicyclomycin/chloramphenicol resistance-like MFS transporter